MEADRFDTLIRHATTTGSRRGLISGVLAVLLAGLDRKTALAVCRQPGEPCNPKRDQC